MSELVVPDGWTSAKLSNFVEEYRKKSIMDNEYEVLTSSKMGLMKQIDYYGKNRITRRSNIGFNVIPEDYITYRSRSDANEFTFNQNTLGFTGLISKYYPVFASKEGKEYNKFFTYLTNFHSAMISLESVGTSQVVLSFNALKAVKLPIPSKQEQKKIASILTSVDDVIEKTQSQINKLQDLKNATINALLTRGIGHTEFKDSAVGRIPKEWFIAKLGDLISSLDGGVSVNGENRPKQAGEYGVLKVSAVSQGLFRPNENKVIIESDLHRAKLHPVADHILFSRANTPALVGESGYIKETRTDLFLPDKLWLMDVKDRNEVNIKWLSYILTHGRVRKLISDAATGTSGSMKNISKPSLLSIAVAVPSKEEEQQKIASILSSIDTNIEEKQRKLEQTKSLKKSLMQDLLTGKVRVTLH